MAYAVLLAMSATAPPWQGADGSWGVHVTGAPNQRACCPTCDRPSARAKGRVTRTFKHCRWTRERSTVDGREKDVIPNYPTESHPSGYAEFMGFRRNQSNDPGKPTRGRTPDSERYENRGPATCKNCGGTGYVETEQLATDDEGVPYTEHVESTCARCGGEGAV